MENRLGDDDEKEINLCVLVAETQWREGLREGGGEFFLESPAEFL